MDLLHDRQRLFAFVFFFDLNEKYKQIIKYKNKFTANNPTHMHQSQQSMKYLIQLLLQCLHMDIFPVRTIKTAQNNETDTNEEDIVMNANNGNTNNKKQFSFGAGNKSQQIDQYYCKSQQRVLMVNVFHEIEHCVVAKSLRFITNFSCYNGEKYANNKLQKLCAKTKQKTWNAMIPTTLMRYYC